MILSLRLLLHIIQLLVIFYPKFSESVPTQALGDTPFWYLLLKPEHRTNVALYENITTEITAVEDNKAFRYTADAHELGTYFHFFQAGEKEIQSIREKFRSYVSGYYI